MITNTQKPEHQYLSLSGDLELHHAFPTIQGEGPFAGTPAVFVRLSGCNLRCPFCDTEYTSKRTLIPPHKLLEVVRSLVSHAGKRKPLVVITGGEPFRQNLTPAVELLLLAGYRVQIETNGTLYLPDFPYDDAVVVCSPKTGRVHYLLAPHVSAFKYVVQAGYIDQLDGLPFATLGNQDQAHVGRPPVGSSAEIFVQPLDEQDETKNKANLEAAIQSCMRFGYRLCIQTHKLANLE